jgi:hypothetical protein
MATTTTIPASNPILFFPVRLETSYELKADGTTDLKVRIIPDEIELQYHITRLTQSDLEEGRRFWVRWFIASGDADREFETWRLFCDKHGANGASRIAFLTRPRALSYFRKGGKDFTKRPYAFRDAKNRHIDIASFCQQIYDSLSDIHITESSAPEKSLTDGATNSFRAISATLASISVVLDGSPQIVDYLSDKVDECVGYLDRRLQSIGKFYDRYPQFKDDPGSFDLRDSDYFAYERIRDQVRDFRSKLARKTVPLEDLIDQYLEHPDFITSFFGQRTFAARYPLKRRSYPAPTLPVFPERFRICLFYKSPETATTQTGFSMLNVSGNPIPSDLSIGMDPEEGSSSAFKIDEKGNIVIPAEMKWLIDYDEAVRKGMAITVNIPSQEAVVTSLYAYGVKEGYDKNDKTIENLFRSHLYWGDQFSFLQIGTPTNQIDGTRPVETPSEEELVKERYRLEILEQGKKAPANSDARILSDLLGIKFNNGPFSRALHSENTEIDNAKKANKALWAFFKTKMVDTDNVPKEKKDRLFDYVEDFFLNYVNARGIAPMFRLDDQPYGIVPIFPLSSLSNGYDTWEKKYLSKIHDLIYKYYYRWGSIFEQDSIAAEGMKGREAERKFLRMLSQNPRSVDYRKRPFYFGPLTENKLYQLDDYRRMSPLARALQSMGFNVATPVAGDFGDVDITPLIDTVKKVLPTIEGWQAERLVSEFLDTFTYRLDVWLLAFASYYLKNKKASSLRVGCYGWIYNLEISKKEAENKGEYILAPSIQHALTAAVLRSSYLQTKADGQDTHLCVNLSSMRARQALRMIDGIKQGMSTGLILGSDLERYLHDAFNRTGKNMDKFIYALRKLFPQTMDIKAEDKRAEDYALQVINGEALLNEILDKQKEFEQEQGRYTGRISDWLKEYAGEMDWFKALKDPQTGLVFTEDEANELFLLIERMMDSYDALNDLLLAEGVHRLVAGDKASFTAISSFMKDGSGNLPAPAILDTPMNYAALAHKAGVALPCKGDTRSKSILATAEPKVNAWLAAQMGPLENIIFHVDYNDGIRQAFFESSIREVGLEPLEFLHLSSYPNALRKALELAWRRRDWRNRKDGQVRILTGDPEELENGEALPDHSTGAKICLYEFSLFTDNLSSLIASARPLRAGDIIPSICGDTTEDSLADIRELKYRYLSVYDALAEINGKLTAFLESPDRTLSNPLTDGQVVSLYDLVGKCIRSGLFNETIPFDPALLLDGIDKVRDRTDYDKAVQRQLKFLSQLKNLSDALARRLAEADALAPDNGETLRPAAYIEALQALTFKNLKVVPRFSVKDFREEFPLKNPTFRSMAKDYSNAANLKGNEFADWMDEVAEVRPGMKLYREIGMLQQLRGSSYYETKIGIFQALAQENVAREWLGCQVSGESVLDDADSLVLFDRQNFDEAQKNAGLIFDSWLEYIPFRKQTAGLVYRCDVPDAEAPQALILGLHGSCLTNPNGKWGDDDIRTAISHVSSLSSFRTIDPEQLYGREKESLIGSFLTARMEDLIDRSASPQAQIDALEAARKSDLVLDQTKVDANSLNIQ